MSSTGPDLPTESSTEHGATPLHQLSSTETRLPSTVGSMAVAPTGWTSSRLGFGTTSVGGPVPGSSGRPIRGARSRRTRWNRRSRRRSMGRTAAGSRSPAPSTRRRHRPNRCTRRGQGRRRRPTGRPARRGHGPETTRRRFGSTSVDGADPTSAGCAPWRPGTGWSRPVHQGPGRPRRF